MWAEALIWGGCYSMIIVGLYIVYSDMPALAGKTKAEIWGGCVFTTIPFLMIAIGIRFL